MRKWFREKYRLSPHDFRYLDLTDEEIEIDFYEGQIFEEEQKKLAEAELPLCSECGYRGQPYPDSSFCPRCGGFMSDEGTVYVDEDFDEYAKSLGIDESELEN